MTNNPPLLLPSAAKYFAGQEFAGRTALITGAGQGIGAALARMLAGLGAQVVIAEINPTGEQIASQIAAARGEAAFVQTDVSDQRSVAALADQVHKRYGPVDILVNNAILSPTAAVLEMDISLWDRVMGVNLRGVFLTCKTFLPGMLTAGRGAIINMVSTEALPFMSAYMASKQGIAAFSRSLSGEVGEQGVRVVAFAPGFVDTPGLRDAAEGLSPHMGLDTEEFMKLSFHPAYQQAMPAEDAGLATALLLSRYLDEFHGDQTDGYTILERAGVIQTAQALLSTVPGVVPEDYRNDLPEAASNIIQPTEVRDKILETARALAVELDATEAEFNQLPIFVRPMARQGFKRKSGQSLEGWKTAITRLVETGEQVSSEAGAFKDGSKLISDLEKLARYYQETPAETARFTREAEVLRHISQISNQRVELIRQLSGLLQQVN